jgi:subtilisin family serine protease
MHAIQLFTLSSLLATSVVCGEQDLKQEKTQSLLAPAIVLTNLGVAPLEDQVARDRIVVRFASQAADNIEAVGRENRGITGLDPLDAVGLVNGVDSLQKQFADATREMSERTGRPDLSGWYIVSFDPARSTPELLARVYRANPLVLDAQTIGLHPLHATVNDPNFSSQWHLDQNNDSDVDMPETWDTQTGSDSVIVAILDTGVRYYHGDLGGSSASSVQNAAGNIWRNTAEASGSPGIDDDGNGYVDDHVGWDFVSSPIYNCYSGEDCNGSDNDPRDFNGHGTHCAGIVGAINNNAYGVASVAGGRSNGSFSSNGNGVRLMCLKIGHSANYQGQEYGFVSMDYAAQALYYAANNGARIASCSWGSSNSGGLGAALDYFIASGGLVFKAAGNDGSQSADYMGSRSDIINVAATDQNDQKASFSTYGTWVDISAPGVDILSTYHYHPDPSSDYSANLSGTSMSTPMVAATAAMVWSQNSSLSPAQVWAAVRDSADDISSSNPAYSGRLGSGRINVEAAVAAAGGGDVDPTGACCLGSTCSSETSADCVALGGTYYGDDSSCLDVDCDPDPTGACCLGTSCSTETEVDCSALGGSYQGDDTNCADISCGDTGGGSNLLMFSFRGNTAISGLGTVRNDDIVSYDQDTGEWAMYFDGSDVGYTSGAIDGFCMLEDGRLLLTKSKASSVDGISYDDSDILIFTPTSTGTDTTGSFEMFLDASDVDLTTNGEDIDGMSLLPDGRLVVSTSGSASVAGLSGIRDEDLMIFNASAFGSTTSGTFELYLDNGDVGLGTRDEDVDAFHLHPSGLVTISTVGNYSVSGATGADEDLLDFAPASTGSNTSGSFSNYITGVDIGIPTGADIGGYSEVIR